MSLFSRPLAVDASWLPLCFSPQRMLQFLGESPSLPWLSRTSCGPPRRRKGYTASFQPTTYNSGLDPSGHPPQKLRVLLQQLPRWFDDYNAVLPHEALKMRSPREARLANSPH
ncbi:integrase core domain-containing protein [Myxococcus stipitatus]|uniref:integrase core domain-containing protein n=1 Tax=Myxococcus stipitatus TaxID=83455 RepID=UPI003AF26E00